MWQIECLRDVHLACLIIHFGLSAVLVPHLILIKGQPSAPSCLPRSVLKITPLSVFPQSLVAA